MPMSTEPAWKGYLYAAGLLVASILQTVFGVQHLKQTLTVGMRVRTVLSSAVYRKALKVSSAARKGMHMHIRISSLKDNI